MAKKVEQEVIIDEQNDSLELDVVEVNNDHYIENKVEEINAQPFNERNAQKGNRKQKEFVSCLKKERVIIRHIPKQTGMVTNPKHVLYGGMAETAKRTFTVPKLSSGAYVNVLTDSEKDFLENIMGLEENSLSIYRKVDNYWENKLVTLGKQDNFLDLSDPDDYIKYKILLSNKDYICPSLQIYEDMPKQTYQFVIIMQSEEVSVAEKNMSATMLSYKEFGKIENDYFKLKTIVELITGKPVGLNSKIEFLKTQINNLIQSDSKRFLKVITDPLLETKVIVKRAVESGIISNRGGMLYLKSDNTPLCDANEEPTLSIAAKYLNHPKHQELKFMIESKLK